MDEAWLGVLAGKDYLFATSGRRAVGDGRAVCRGAGRRLAGRRRTAWRSRASGPMVLGLAALAAIFVATLPLVAARVALAVQFQVSRVFWMLDVSATLYAVWALADGAGRLVERPSHRRAAARGLRPRRAGRRPGRYVMWVEHPGRPVVQADLPAATGRTRCVAAAAARRHADPGRPGACVALRHQRARGGRPGRRTSKR